MFIFNLNDIVNIKDNSINEFGLDLKNVVKKLNKFDILVGIHPYEEHIGGIDNIINNFEIGKIFEIKLKDLQFNVNEGNILNYANNVYPIDKEEEIKRKERINKKKNNLWGKRELM